MVFSGAEDKYVNVSLTPELEDLVEGKVKGGLYNSASEVVREGLRLLQQRDEMRELKLEALRKEIQKGIDDLEAGRFRDGAEVMTDIKDRLIKLKPQNA